MNILFQRGTYYITTFEAIKNELKVAITLEFVYKQPSSIEKISYTVVSLMNHDGDSLDCGHFFSDVFDANRGIWWHCDDDNITQMSDLPKPPDNGQTLSAKPSVGAPKKHGDRCDRQNCTSHNTPVLYAPAGCEVRAG